MGDACPGCRVTIWGHTVWSRALLPLTLLLIERVEEARCPGEKAEPSAQATGSLCLRPLGIFWKFLGREKALCNFCVLKLQFVSKVQFLIPISSSLPASFSSLLPQGEVVTGRVRSAQQGTRSSGSCPALHGGQRQERFWLALPTALCPPPCGPAAGSTPLGSQHASWWVRLTVRLGFPGS